MIVIIGAGPAGLMAAEYLATRQHKVRVFDRMPSVARKFLMAGRGGLNITHSEPLNDFLARYGTDDPRLLDAIRAFPPEALRDWCHGLGQETMVGSSGRVFPKAMKASPLLRAWLQRLQTLGVEILPRHEWQGVTPDGALIFATPDGPHIEQADACILALGGASWPKLGSDGGWAGILTGRGIPFAPFRPANSGFKVAWSDFFHSRHAGQPLKNIMLRIGDQHARGDAMITRTGIEGGAVYALSRPIRDALETGDGPITISIDLRPDMAIADMMARLERPRRGQSLGNHLRRHLTLSTMNWHLLCETTPQIQTLDMVTLARRIKAVPLVLTAPFGLERAISSAGGVCLSALDAHGMVRNWPGMFATGEMLDWEAPTGGYLLQACFAHARMVAAGVDAWLQSGHIAHLT